MATKKNVPRDWDNFGTDDRATDAKSRGLFGITPPPKKKPVAKKPATKKK